MFGGIDVEVAGSGSGKSRCFDQISNIVNSCFIIIASLFLPLRVTLAFLCYYLRNKLLFLFFGFILYGSNKYSHGRMLKFMLVVLFIVK